MWLGYLPKRCWLFIRSGHFWIVQSLKWPETHRSCSSTSDEWLQLVSWPQCNHCFLGTKLLLQVRKWSSNHGSGRVHEVHFPTVQPSSKAKRTSSQQKNSRLFPVSKKSTITDKLYLLFHNSNLKSYQLLFESSHFRAKILYLSLIQIISIYIQTQLLASYKY